MRQGDDFMSIQKQHNTKRSTATLMVRLDKDSKEALAQAASLRRISISDYVRLVTVPQARKELSTARDQTISLSPAEQVAFWTALQNATTLTPAQKSLGKIMRGES